jgi:exodeoxyribonuclease V alpha subunit
MLGSAQKLFAERSSQSPLSPIKQSPHWPLLEKMLNQKNLGYIDFSLARHLLQKVPIDPNQTEALAAFICHLSMAVREGHVCVCITEEGEINPSVAQIWIAEEEKEGNPNDSATQDLETITQWISQIAQNKEFTLICRIDHQEELRSPIYEYQQHYYLQRYRILETSFLTSFKRLFLPTGTEVNFQSCFVPPPAIDLLQIEKQVERWLFTQQLLPEQAQAILAAAQFSLTLITGGPGTGKTYTAGKLIRALVDAIVPEERSRFKIALAAPTGKAAANLEASIKKALGSQDDKLVMTAQTLHQLLGLKTNSYRKSVLLDADLILVDESSMIDLNLMQQLLSAIKPGTRLVLLGDQDQLPAVEVGAVFADLIYAFSSDETMKSQVITLKTCLRAELQGIVELATHIKMGDHQEVTKLLKEETHGIRLIEIDKKMSIKEHHKRFLADVLPHFPVAFSGSESPVDLLKAFSHFKILTPMRQGVFGVETLNALIFQALNKKVSHSDYHVIPILIMQNDYRLDLFNGETGVLLKNKEKETAFFASRESDGQVREIPAVLLPRFEYAYCLSIHKSQGSEFNYVMLVLPEEAASFGRAALYTGVTRAKKQLSIWSDHGILGQMMSQTGKRQSGISVRLLELLS